MAIEALRNALVNAPAVTALVPEARITPLVRPQGLTIPAITLQRIASLPHNHLRGSATVDNNQVQLDIYAATSSTKTGYAAAREIADAAREAGEAGGFTLQSEIDGYDSDTDPELYRVTQTWSVFI